MVQQIAEITKVPTNAQVIKILNEVIKRYNSLANIYTFKGNVQTYDDLLAIQNPNIGDVYNVVEEDEEHQIAAGSNFVWDGTVWDNLGGSLAGLVQSVNGINPDSLGNVLLPLIKNITTNQGVIAFTKNDDTTIQVDNIKKLYTVGLGQTVDLNNLVEAGIYMCGNDSYAANYENCPVQKSFLLEVQQANDESMVYQFLTQYNDGSTEAGNQYVRTYQATNGWSAWRMAGSGSNLTTYTSLEQIGITPGEETLESIHNALPLNSVLEYTVAVSGIYNDEIYPTNYGLVRVSKLIGSLTFFEYLQYTTEIRSGSGADNTNSNNICMIWTTTYNSSYPNRVMTWNKALSSKTEASQTLHSTLTQAVIDDSQAGVGIADYAGYSKDGLRRIGGFQVAKQSVGDELRSRNVLYVVDDDNTYHSTIYSDWSPSQNMVLTTMRGLVRILDHIQFIGKDDGQFGYTEVTSGTGVKTIPRGNYFFYGTAAEWDSDTVLAGTDFQGISMRQSGQALQIVCTGNKMYWRYDDSSDVATNPQYSSWIQFSDSNNLASAKSINTNGIDAGNYYYRLPDGLQICMGVVDLTISDAETQVGPFNFAAAFTYAPKVVVCMINIDASYPERYDSDVQVRSISTTNFYLYQQAMGNAWFYRASYIAIGRWN